MLLIFCIITGDRNRRMERKVNRIRSYVFSPFFLESKSTHDKKSESNSIIHFSLHFSWVSKSTHDKEIESNSMIHFPLSFLGIEIDARQEKWIDFDRCDVRQCPCRSKNHASSENAVEFDDHFSLRGSESTSPRKNGWNSMHQFESTNLHQLIRYMPRRLQIYVRPQKKRSVVIRSRVSLIWIINVRKIKGGKKNECSCKKHKKVSLQRACLLNRDACLFGGFGTN